MPPEEPPVAAASAETCVPVSLPISVSLPVALPVLVAVTLPVALSDAPWRPSLFSVESLLLPNGFPWLSLLVRRKESYAVKTATSELSRPVAATYLAIVPLATADSGSALPDLRPSATVALRAPPVPTDAP